MVNPSILLQINSLYSKTTNFSDEQNLKINKIKFIKDKSKFVAVQNFKIKNTKILQFL